MTPKPGKKGGGLVDLGKANRFSASSVMGKDAETIFT
jgi:hypothetical protein